MIKDFQSIHLSRVIILLHQTSTTSISSQSDLMNNQKESIHNGNVISITLQLFHPASHPASPLFQLLSVPNTKCYHVSCGLTFPHVQAGKLNKALELHSSSRATLNNSPQDVVTSCQTALPPEFKSPRLVQFVAGVESKSSCCFC